MSQLLVHSMYECEFGIFCVRTCMETCSILDVSYGLACLTIDVLYDLALSTCCI